MNCHTFDKRIQQLLDARQPLVGDALLEAHALACPACEETLATYQCMLLGVRQLPRPSLDSGFAARVVGEAQLPEVKVAARGGTSSRVRWLAPLATVAALLLVAVAVGVWSGNGRGSADATVSAGGSPHNQATRGVVGVALPGPVGKAPSADEAVATHVPAPTVAPVAPAPPYSAPLPYPVYDYRTAIESLTGQWPGTVGQFEYAPGVRPIRESFSTAFETLLRTLPGRADGREPQPLQSSFLAGPYSCIA